MAGAGRAEVERFLLHRLSLSLLVGFISSDSSRLQENLPNSLSHPYNDPGSFGTWLVLAPPGMNGDICAMCHPASAAELPLDPSGTGSVPVPSRDPTLRIL